MHKVSHKRRHFAHKTADGIALLYRQPVDVAEALCGVRTHSWAQLTNTLWPCVGIQGFEALSLDATLNTEGDCAE